MPRLQILYDIEGWAYHRRAQALQRYAPAEYEVALSAWSGDDDGPDLGDVEPDVIFCMSYSRLRQLRADLDRRGWKSAVVGAWTTGWPRWISHFPEALEHSDLLIVNHHDAWARMGELPGTVMIPNGVDHEVFGVTRDIATRAPRVLWTGSLFHSGVKGYRSHIVPLFDALQAAGIEGEALLVDSHRGDMRTPDQMAEWYNGGSVLVCASELEGTPNPCLEAAACGCTLVSTPVGNMPQLIRDGVNGHLVDRTVEALFDGVQKAVANYADLAAQMQLDIRAWFYETRASAFFEAFDRALSIRRGAAMVRVASSRQDLRDEVTVFVSTVGAPSYDACRQYLGLQDCDFGVDVIERVAPMSAAFQQMIDRCATPYYIQVDEDMLLYPNAIRHLHAWIGASAENVALCAGALLDAHLRRPILGVKIFRHSIVGRFPHADVEASESHQMGRLAEAGFDALTQTLDASQGEVQALGLHGTHWTPELIFERYATLERKRRRSPETRAWVAECPEVFLSRYLASRASLSDLAGSSAPRSAVARLEREIELDLYALLGCLAGSRMTLNGDGGEKDFRTYGAPEGFQAVRELLGHLKGSDLQ